MTSYTDSTHRVRMAVAPMLSLFVAGGAVVARGTSAACDLYDSPPELLLMLQMEATSSEEADSTATTVGKAAHLTEVMEHSVFGPLFAQQQRADLTSDLFAQVTAMGVGIPIALGVVILVVAVAACLVMYEPKAKAPLVSRPPGMYNRRASLGRRGSDAHAPTALSLPGHYSACATPASFSASPTPKVTSPRMTQGVSMRAPLDNDLVVPAGSECNLLMSNPRQAGIEITDMLGNHILMVVPQWEQPKGKLPSEISLPWMELRSVSGQVMAVFAKIHSGRRSRYAIYRPNFELFGQIVPSGSYGGRGGMQEWPDQYQLEAVSGDMYRIYGNVSERRVQIALPDGALLAVSEPSSADSCFVRAAALTDVGVVVCTLVSLECLR